MMRRSRCVPIAVPVLIGALAGSPCLAQSAEPESRRTGARLPENLVRPIIGLADRDAAAPLIVGGFGTAVATAFDDEVRRAVARPGTRFGRALEKAGGPLVSSLFVGGMFVAGQIGHDPRFHDMTYDMLCASAATAALTAALKLVVRRSRPNGANKRSFPSAHASNAFALAAVAQEHYGWKAGVPAYAVASAIGASRLVQDAHYLSDVVAGGTLGYMVGASAVRMNSQPVENGPPPPVPAAAWHLSPLLGKGKAGMRVLVVF